MYYTETKLPAFIYILGKQVQLTLEKQKNYHLQEFIKNKLQISYVKNTKFCLTPQMEGLVYKRH